MALLWTSLEQAVGALRTSLRVQASLSDDSAQDLREVVRAGVIQNFEICYEQCWKTIQRWLQENANPAIADVLRSRRDLFRHAANRGLIDDAEVWFSFGLARNATAHTYRESTAIEVAAQAKNFLEEAVRLLEVLQRDQD